MASRLFYQQTTASLAARRDFDKEAYYGEGSDESDDESPASYASPSWSTPYNLQKHRPSVAVNDRSAVSASSAEAFFRQRERVRQQDDNGQSVTCTPSSSSSSRKSARKAVKISGGGSVTSFSSSRSGISRKSYRYSQEDDDLDSLLGETPSKKVFSNDKRSSTMSSSGSIDRRCTPHFPKTPQRVVSPYNDVPSQLTTSFSSPLFRESGIPSFKSRTSSSSVVSAGKPDDTATYFSTSSVGGTPGFRSKRPIAITPPPPPMDDDVPRSQQFMSPQQQFDPAERKAIVRDVVDWFRSFDFDMSQLNKIEKRALIKLAGTGNASRDKGESLDKAAMTAATWVQRNDLDHRTLENAMFQELLRFPLATKSVSSHRRKLTPRQKQRILKKVVDWIRQNDLLVDDLQDITLRALSKVAGKTLKYGPTHLEREEAFDHAMGWLRAHNPNVALVDDESARYLIDFPPSITREEKERLAKAVQDWARQCTPSLQDVDDRTLDALLVLTGHVILSEQFTTEREFEQALEDAVQWLRDNDVDIDRISSDTGRKLRYFPPPVSWDEKARVAQVVVEWARFENPKPQDTAEDRTLRALAKCTGRETEETLSNFERELAHGDAVDCLRNYQPDIRLMDDNATRQLARFPPPLALEEKQQIAQAITDWARNSYPDPKDTNAVIVEALGKVTGVGMKVNSPSRVERTDAFYSAVDWLRDNDLDVHGFDDHTWRRLRDFPPGVPAKEKLRIAKAVMDWARSPKKLTAESVDTLTLEALTHLKGEELVQDPSEKEVQKAFEDVAKYFKDNDIDIERMDNDTARQLTDFPPAYFNHQVDEVPILCDTAVRLDTFFSEAEDNDDYPSDHVDDSSVQWEEDENGVTILQAISKAKASPSDRDREKLFDSIFASWREDDPDELIEDNTDCHLLKLTPVVSLKEKQRVAQAVAAWTQCPMPELDDVDDATLTALANLAGEKVIPTDLSHGERVSLYIDIIRLLRETSFHPESMDDDIVRQLASFPPPVSLEKKKRIARSVSGWAQFPRPRKEDIADDLTLSALAKISEVKVKANASSKERDMVITEIVESLRKKYLDPESIEDDTARHLATFPPPVSLEEKERVARAVASWLNCPKPEPNEVSDVILIALANLAGGALTNADLSGGERESRFKDIVDLLKETNLEPENMKDSTARQLATFPPPVSVHEKERVARAVTGWARFPRPSEDDIADDLTLAALVKIADVKVTVASGRDTVVKNIVESLRRKDVNPERLEDDAARRLAAFPPPVSLEEKERVARAVASWVQYPKPEQDDVDDDTLIALTKLVGEELTHACLSDGERESLFKDIIDVLKETMLEPENMDDSTARQLATFPPLVSVQEKERVARAVTGWARFPRPSEYDIADDLTLAALVKIAEGTVAETSELDAERGKVVKNIVESLRRKDVNPERLEDDTARRLATFPPPVSLEEKERIARAVACWVQYPKPEQDDVDDDTITALAKLVREELTHACLSDGERESLFKDIIDVLKETMLEPENMDDSTARQLATFPPPVSMDVKKRIARAVTKWARFPCPRNEDIVDDRTFGALAVVAEVEVKSCASNGEGENISNIVESLKKKDVDPETMEDDTARLLATFPAPVSFEEKERVARAVARWAQFPNPKQDDVLEDPILFALGNLARVEHPQRILSAEERNSFFFDVTCLLRDTMLAPEYMQDDIARQLATFPPHVPKEEKERVAQAVSSWARLPRPRKEDVEDSSILFALAILAGRKFSEDLSMSELDSLFNDVVHSLRVAILDPESMEDDTARQLAIFPPPVPFEAKERVAQAVNSWARLDCPNKEDVIEGDTLLALAKLARVKLPSCGLESERDYFFNEVVDSLRSKVLDPVSVEDDAARRLVNFPLAVSFLEKGRISRTRAASAACPNQMLDDNDDNTASGASDEVVEQQQHSGLSTEEQRQVLPVLLEEKGHIVRVVMGWARRSNPTLDDVADDETLAALAELAGEQQMFNLPNRERELVFLTIIGSFREKDVDPETVSDDTARKLAAFSPPVSPTEKKRIATAVTAWCRCSHPKLTEIASNTILGALATVAMTRLDDCPSDRERQEAFVDIIDFFRLHDVDPESIDDNTARALACFPPDVSLEEKERITQNVSDWARTTTPMEEDIDNQTLNALVKLSGRKLKNDLLPSERQNGLDHTVEFFRNHSPDVDRMDDTTARQLSDFPPLVPLEERKRIVRAVTDWARSTNPEVQDIDDMTTKALAKLSGNNEETLEISVRLLRIYDPDPAEIENNTARQLFRFPPPVSFEEKERVAKAVVSWACSPFPKAEEVDDMALEALAKLTSIDLTGERTQVDKEKLLDTVIDALEQFGLEPSQLGDNTARQLAQFPPPIPLEEKQRIVKAVTDWARCTTPKVEDIEDRVLVALGNLTGVAFEPDQPHHKQTQSLDAIANALRNTDQSASKNLSDDTARHLSRFPPPMYPEEKTRIVESVVDWVRNSNLKPEEIDSNTLLAMTKLTRVEIEGTHSHVFGKVISWLISNNPDPRAIDDTTARKLSQFPDNSLFAGVPSEEKETIVKAVIERIRFNDPKPEELDRSTIHALADFAGKPRHGFEDNPSAALDDTLAWIRGNKANPSTIDDRTVRDLSRFLWVTRHHLFPPGLKESIVRNAVAWARSEHPSLNDLDNSMLRGLLSLAKVPEGSPFALKESLQKQKLFEDAIGRLKNTDPDNSVNDSTVCELARFPVAHVGRMLFPEEKKRIVAECVDWIQNNDPKPKIVDVVMLLNLCKMSGLSISDQALADSEHQDVLCSVVGWIRHNSLSPKYLDDRTVDSLASLTGVSLSERLDLIPEVSIESPVTATSGQNLGEVLQRTSPSTKDSSHSQLPSQSKKNRGLFLCLFRPLKKKSYGKLNTKSTKNYT